MHKRVRGRETEKQSETEAEAITETYRQIQRDVHRRKQRDKAWKNKVNNFNKNAKMGVVFYFRVLLHSYKKYLKSFEGVHEVPSLPPHAPRPPHSLHLCTYQKKTLDIPK
jgi:hypothetical protein